MLKLKDIRKVHVELTTRCNARCPMCMRNYRGYDYNGGYPLTELTLADFKKILPPTILAQLTTVLINGNLGDFGLARDAQEIVHYLVEHGKSVSISTNGSMRTPDWWANLALPGVEIGWAIDGLADTHSLYRQDTNWHTVIANAQAFINAGGNATWRFIAFHHNRHQEAQCRELAKSMGFSQFYDISGGRDQGFVYTRNGEYSHAIGPLGEPEEPPAIQDLLESHVTWFDSKTIKHDRDQPEGIVDLICEHKRQEEIYIAADGTVYPCCFLGFYPTTMHHPGNDQVKPLIQENNALEYDLSHCLEWFEKVEQTWAKPSIADGRLYQCVASCGGRSKIQQKNLL